MDYNQEDSWEDIGETAEAIMSVGCLMLLLICVVGLFAGYNIGKNKYDSVERVERAAEKAQTLEECYGTAIGLNLDPEFVCSEGKP